MTDIIKYKNELNSILIIEDESQIELFEHKTNTTSFQNKNSSNSTVNTSNNQFHVSSHFPNDDRNKKSFYKTQFELALMQAKLKYCYTTQLLSKLNLEVDFIIPKYRIAIICEMNSQTEEQAEEILIVQKSENHKMRSEIYEFEKNTWKLFRLSEIDIENNFEIIISDIKKHIKRNRNKISPKFTFVDLYAGIGGFRIPLEKLGGKCLGFSEIDKNAIETYKNNFEDFEIKEEKELGSITDLGKLPFEQIDLIVGGVPCQSWSVAGKMRGFDDPRGKLWHDTIRVVELNKPNAFIFENVKGLIDPRNKENLELIVASFEEIGYNVKYQLLNSYDFGLPQNRDRIFIVGFQKESKKEFQSFNFPLVQNRKSYLFEILEGHNNDTSTVKKEIIDPKQLFGSKIPMGRNRFQKTNEFNDFFIFCDTRNGHTTIHSWDIFNTSNREKDICMTILKNRRKKIYGPSDGNALSFEILSDLIPNLEEHELDSLIDKKIIKYLDGQGYIFVNSKNSAGINGIYRIYLPHSNIFSTLTATGTKDMVALKNIFAKTPKEYKDKFIDEIVKKKNYRPISAKECGRLQGFPDWFAIHKNETIAKKQFGNAVSTNVIYNLAESLLKTNIFNLKT